MIGDIRQLPNGFTEEVISETAITGYMNETPEQEKERVKKGLPYPTYGYIAVRVEVRRDK